MTAINETISRDIRERARDLLATGTVTAFLGFTAGSVPMSMRPFVARTPEETEKFVWNSFCVLNLANFLPELVRTLPEDKPGKIGVLATGCWSRNMVVLTQENQLRREQVHIVGIASRGMVLPRKLRALFPGREITRVVEEEHQLQVEGPGFSETVNRWSVVRDNCQSCSHPDPVIFDEMITAHSTRKPLPDRFRQIEEIEDLPSDERYQWFQDEIGSCIRCYACRNACPLCYCPTCFVDDSRPQWVGKSLDPVDVSLFHILRAYHCAGRCTDCGACEAACPMGIRMRLFTRKLEKDVLALFGTEAGMDPGQPQPLATYGPDDPQDFMLRG
ncbi:4Fe-4S dicluster domain-containing protein [Desulfolithobacter sp.]